MSMNQLDDPDDGPACLICGGCTHEWLEDSPGDDQCGHYWQCEDCGECVDIQD